MGALSSGDSYTMLMRRPNKAGTAAMAANVLSAKSVCSYRVNSLYHCRLCALSVAIAFPFKLRNLTLQRYLMRAMQSCMPHRSVHIVC